MSFTASPHTILWRISRYLLKDHGLRKSTLSISSFVWKRNITLFSPRSLTSKLFSAFYTDFNTLATDSRFTRRFVQNFPMRTGPSSVNGTLISTSASSFNDNFSPAHLSVISSMCSSRKNYFYRLHGESVFLTVALVLYQAPSFTSRFSKKDLERKPLFTFLV